MLKNIQIYLLGCCEYLYFVIIINHLKLIDMKTYDIILQGSEATIENAIDLCNGLDWSEIEISEQNLPNKRYEETINGIDIYYDYAADYYFFSPSNN